MNSEQLLIQKWRSLPANKQQEVIDFVEFLELKSAAASSDKPELKSKPRLGERLRKLREEIVVSGVPLLDWKEIELEKAERRGGCQEDAE